MARDKYPEKVPFRLTRMLRNAMDVSRIEGVFRTTCEHSESSLLNDTLALAEVALCSYACFERQ